MMGMVFQFSRFLSCSTVPGHIVRCAARDGGGNESGTKDVRCTGGRGAGKSDTRATVGDCDIRSSRARRTGSVGVTRSTRRSKNAPYVCPLPIYRSYHVSLT